MINDNYNLLIMNCVLISFVTNYYNPVLHVRVHVQCIIPYRAYCTCEI